MVIKCGQPKSTSAMISCTSTFTERLLAHFRLNFSSEYAANETLMFTFQSVNGQADLSQFVYLIAALKANKGCLLALCGA